MKIYLCRHGETDYNKDHRIMGHLPIPLNCTGRQQAEILAKALEHRGIEIIYSSDLKRAEETTQIIDSTLNLPIVYCEDLREYTVGKYDGIDVFEFHEILEKVGKFDDLMIEIGGEITEDFMNRVWEKFNEIVEMNREKESILIVSHGGFIRSIIGKILEIPNYPESLKQDNCCINVISYTNKENKSRFLVESVNNTCHFDE